MTGAFRAGDVFRREHMAQFEFYDAAGNVHPFETYAEAEAFALGAGYVFVTSRSVMEGSKDRIAYFVAASDVPEGVTDRNELFPVLLARYPEWKEPRIMPVPDSDTMTDGKA